jgi:hypothetical protein
MKVETMIFDRNEVYKNTPDKMINRFIENKKVISISVAVSSGNILGGGGMVYVILYED